MSFYFLLSILALQRLGELRVGNDNLEQGRKRLVSPPDEGEARRMMILHSAWFVACAAEFTLAGSLVPAPWFLAGIAILAGCQFVRHQSMHLLGKQWVHLPVAFHGQKIVKEGIYRITRHPNYLAVVIEIAVVPLLGRANFTAILFSAANGIFLWQRIKAEETQLKLARRSS